MSAAPDFVAPVVGYRAWHLDADGVLAPWSFPQHPWEPGVNHARCLREPRHRPPVGDCMCGLYGLTDPRDRRLSFHGDQAVGAIAAWGDMEVHRTGFRAQHACVVALAVPERCRPEVLAALRRAAARHRCELVPARELSREAHRHGAPLPDDLWTPPAPVRARGGGTRRPASAAFAGPARPRGGGGGVPPVDPAAFAGPVRGIAADEHLWVEAALGAVVVGATAALGAELDPAGPLALPEPGLHVAAGDRLATLPGPSGPLAAFAPVSGTVVAVNPRLAADPGLLQRAPEGAGWLVRLSPSAWDADAAGVLWGAGADAHYAALLDRARRTGDPFAGVRLGRLHALGPVRSWQDVLEALRRERRRSRFADAAALRDELGGRLERLLGRDPVLQERLGRLGQLVAWEVTDPDEVLVLDLRGGGARLAWGAAAAVGADLRLRSPADLLLRWATGTLDPAGALRRGELTADRPAPAALRALAVLKHLRVEPWPARPFA